MSKRYATTWLLAALLVGAGLRFCGLYWDFPHLLHGDERVLVDVASHLGDQVAAGRVPNPYFSTWGLLPMYLAWVGAAPLKLLALALGKPWTAPELLLLSGRTISALADVLSIYLVFWLGSRGGRLAGLIAAGLYAVALLPVRESHFFSGYTLACCFMLLYVISCVQAGHAPTRAAWTRCGAAFGLCLATNLALLPLGVLSLVVFWEAVGRGVDSGGDPKIFRLVRAVRQVRAAAAILPLLPLLAAVVWANNRDRIVDLANQELAAENQATRFAAHSAEYWNVHVQSIFESLQWGFTALAVAAIAVAAVVILGSQANRGPRRAYEAVGRFPALGRSAAISALVFLVLNPQAAFDALHYWAPTGPHRITWALLWAVGALQPPLPGTEQFSGTVPLLYQMRHVFPYAWGAPLTVAFLAGWVWGLHRLFARKAGKLWAMCALLLILTVGALLEWVKVTRGMLPLTVALCPPTGVLAASLLGSWTRRPAVGLKLGLLVVGASSLLMSASYVGGYRRTDARVAAAAWLAHHARPGVVVAAEEDDAWGGAPAEILTQGTSLRLAMLSPLDTAQDSASTGPSGGKAATPEQRLRQDLARADYVAVTDNNLTRFRALDDAVPATNRFYDDLFAGRLGVFPKLTHTRRWELLGWHIDDSDSEPSFRYLDHPQVWTLTR